MMAPQDTGKAVVLLSGGVDSATTMAIARSEDRELYALSFDYGQRHLRELESAEMVAEFFGVIKHLVVNFNLRDIGGSALTSDIEVPKAGIRGRDQGYENIIAQSPTPNLQSLLHTCLPAIRSSSPLRWPGQRS